MEHNFIDYIGLNFVDFRKIVPFYSWKFRRSVYRDDLETRINYINAKLGLEIQCDQSEVIATIFLHAKKFYDKLSDCKFNWTPQVIREKIGKPVRRIAAHRDILGQAGDAEIFMFSKVKLHIEYNWKSPGIKQFTFINLDDF